MGYLAPSTLAEITRIDSTYTFNFFLNGRNDGEAEARCWADRQGLLNELALLDRGLRVELSEGVPDGLTYMASLQVTTSSEAAEELCFDLYDTERDGWTEDEEPYTARDFGFSNYNR